jgi:hypothetical protein
MRCIINEKRGLFDLLFVAEFKQKQQDELRSSDLKWSNMSEFVRFGIDSSVQPVLFVVDPNHCLIQCDLIRILVAGWL